MQKALVERKQAVVKAEQEVVKLTVEASQKQTVAVTKANELLAVAKIKLLAAKDEAAAVRSRGKAAAEIVKLENAAQAAGWKQAVAAFQGDGLRYARFVLLEKMAPAYRQIMANTADSPIMDIFKDFRAAAGNARPAEGDHRTRKSTMNGSVRQAMWVGVAAFWIFVAGLAFQWTVSRVYVPEGKSLLLRYKGSLLFGRSKTAPPGAFANYEQGESGMLEQLRGPGRHFYCPIWWECTLVEDMVVEPGQVAIAKSNLGENLPADQFLVDGDLGHTKYKGIFRKGLRPGTLSLQPLRLRIQSHRNREAHGRRPGEDGRLGNDSHRLCGRGHQPGRQPGHRRQGRRAGKVLPPGIYPINPREQEIDIIEIGYREKTVLTNQKIGPDGKLVLDESGEPTVAENNSGINFPSNDGFPINMDFTAIWGLMPDQAPAAVKQFGNVMAVENKFVVPQIESICRNLGSTKGAVELLVGESRQEVPDRHVAGLPEGDEGEERHAALRTGAAHLHSDRSPHSDPECEHRRRIEAYPRAGADHSQGRSRFARSRAKGHAGSFARIRRNRKARGRDAGRRPQGSRANNRRHDSNGRGHRQGNGRTRSPGPRHRRRGQKRGREAVAGGQADKFRLAVEAFGSGEAFNNWVFASNLPTDIKLDLFYAGEGTFWTDLQGVSGLLGKQLQQQVQPTKTPRPRANRVCRATNFGRQPTLRGHRPRGERPLRHHPPPPPPPPPPMA